MVIKLIIFYKILIKYFKIINYTLLEYEYNFKLKKNYYNKKNIRISIKNYISFKTILFENPYLRKFCFPLLYHFLQFFQIKKEN